MRFGSIFPNWRKRSMVRAFISYANKHEAVVRSFHSYSTIFSSEIFFDQRSIPLGSDFPRQICSAIDNCEVFILMWCACASESSWVIMELDRALNADKKIVPVLLSDYPLPPEVERKNGIKLNFELCHKSGFGIDHGSHLFEDAFSNIPANQKMAIVKEIEQQLKSR